MIRLQGNGWRKDLRRVLWVRGEAGRQRVIKIQLLRRTLPLLIVLPTIYHRMTRISKPRGPHSFFHNNTSRTFSSFHVVHIMFPRKPKSEVCIQIKYLSVAVFCRDPEGITVRGVVLTSPSSLPWRNISLFHELHETIVGLLPSWNC